MPCTISSDRTAPLTLRLKGALARLKGGSAGVARINEIINSGMIAAMMNACKNVAGYDRAALEARR